MKASIIVLAYNQLEETTKPCIESIYRNTLQNDFELIIVDNASTDGTGAYLKELEKKYGNVTIVLNEENKGYAAGNNDGIKIARGNFVVLLNSDTLVTKGWLDSLLYPFSMDEKIGLVGPVSNSVGNEQIVFITGINEANYEDFSKKYVTANKDKYCLTKRLGFFCVAIRKSVIDKIGSLDELFGIGTFEDDDYCMKAMKSGLFLAISEGCFVYHKGSVSFEKFFTSDERRMLFENNRRKFNAKWKTHWKFSDAVAAQLEKLRKEVEDFQGDGSGILQRIGKIEADLIMLGHMEEECEENRKRMEGVIFEMKSSKFWRLRDSYMKIKTMIGF